MTARIDASELTVLADRLAKMAERLPQSLESRLDEMGQSVGEMATDEIRTVTPIGKTYPDDARGDYTPGALRDSTHPEIVRDGLITDIRIIQNAASRGFLYAGVVIHGRGPVQARPGSALRTPWGPRKSVGPASPNPYPEQATPAITSNLTRLGRVAAGEAVRSAEA